jgi:hypothetical protein
MRAYVIRNATARVLGVATLGWSSLAGAEPVAIRAGEPGAPQAAPLVVVNEGAPPVAPEPMVAAEPAVRFVTRPNRTSLLTGLIAFGQAYIASVGIAATSPRDSNLWIPAVGPWLDLGERPACRTSQDCSMELGIRVLLVGDGILQTFGAFEIIGAFLWPETISVPAVTTASGASFSFAPARVGGNGYGVAGIGHF